MTPGVVVVAFGAPVLLGRALQPLDAQDVVVVDNSSRADVRAVCESWGVRYQDPGRNLGFAAAVNRGIRAFDAGRDILVLNPDAVVDAPGLRGLMTALAVDPRRAAVAPRLSGPDGAQRAAWPWPAPGSMWREALGLARDEQREDFLTGAVLLVRGAALTEVGLFDEQFFLYAEETDWQRRATARGWSVHVATDVIAEHQGAGTSTDPRRRDALFHAGTETYVRKWFGARGWASYRAASVVGATLRSVLPGARGTVARRRAILYLRGPRRAAGLDA